jgi:hypothetical protein
MAQDHPITPPPPHLLKKFSNEARNEANKRNGAGYLKTFAKLCIEWANSKSTSSLSQIRSSEIQLPTELLAEWLQQACECSHHDHSPGAIGGFMAYKAAQWGADQTQGAVNEAELQKARDEELDACCEWLDREGWSGESRQLRAARRPEPPSLKEQALKMLRPLSNPVMPGTPEYRLYEPQAEIIRRALEGIDD